jgi:hypothetical protein
MAFNTRIIRTRHLEYIGTAGGHTGGVLGRHKRDFLGWIDDDKALARCPREWLDEFIEIRDQVEEDFFDYYYDCGVHTLRDE